jgi:hypothetical protein
MSGFFTQRAIARTFVFNGLDLVSGVPYGFLSGGRKAENPLGD